jgi:hypothetical protein
MISVICDTSVPSVNFCSADSQLTKAHWAMIRSPAWQLQKRPFADSLHDSCSVFFTACRAQFFCHCFVLCAHALCSVLRAHALCLTGFLVTARQALSTKHAKSVSTLFLEAPAHGKNWVFLSRTAKHRAQSMSMKQAICDLKM